MMNKEFFTREMQKLIEQFGEKAFSQHKINLIHNAVYRLDTEEFAHIIDEIVGSNKYAPTLNEIRDRAKGYLSSKAKEKPVECSYCNSSGAMTVYRRDNAYPCAYAFRCTCKNGNQYTNFPLWKDSLRKVYTMATPSKEMFA